MQLLSGECPTVGMVNLGSTCYLNSVLQLCLHVLPLSLTLMTMHVDSSTSPSNTKLLRSLQDGIRSMERGREWNPSEFVRSFRRPNNTAIDPSVQEDAHEFLSFFLDRLDSILSTQGTPTPISRLFECTTHVELRCPQCGLISSHTEHDRCLSLEVKRMRTIEESLSALTKEEPIESRRERSLFHRFPLRLLSLAPHCGEATGLRLASSLPFPPPEAFRLRSLQRDAFQARDASLLLHHALLLLLLLSAPRRHHARRYCHLRALSLLPLHARRVDGGQ